MTKARLCDSIAIFPRQEAATALKGDRFYFSGLASATTTHGGVHAYIDVKGALAPFVTTYVVDHVPVRLPHYRDKADPDYLSSGVELFPDVLRPAKRMHLMDMLHQIVFEVNVPKDLAPGSYPITVALRTDEMMEVVAEETLTLEVLDC